MRDYIQQCKRAAKMSAKLGNYWVRIKFYNNKVVQDYYIQRQLEHLLKNQYYLGLTPVLDVITFLNEQGRADEIQAYLDFVDNIIIKI